MDHGYLWYQVCYTSTLRRYVLFFGRDVDTKDVTTNLAICLQKPCDTGRFLASNLFQMPIAETWRLARSIGIWWLFSGGTRYGVRSGWHLVSWNFSHSRNLDVQKASRGSCSNGCWVSGPKCRHVRAYFELQIHSHQLGIFWKYWKLLKKGLK